MSMMMENNGMLTTESQSDLNNFQCQHNNKGYCKFGIQCRYQHYSKICEKKFCKTKECPSRHPKPCKNGEKCKFHKNDCCAYQHKDNDKFQDILSDSIKKSLEEVDKLKLEISKLKDTIKEKEAVIQSRLKQERDKETMIDELSEKLKNLKDINISLRADNEHLMDRISFKHSELEKIQAELACNKCDFQAESMTEFLMHTESDHGEEKEKMFTCNHCDLTFNKEFDLQIHNSAKHTVKSFGFTSTKERKAFLFPNIPSK